MTKTKRPRRPSEVAQLDTRVTGTPLLTASDAAKALAISTNKLAELTKAGEIPCVRLGRAVRYDRKDLTALIERSKTRK